jgi:hypothetical protein
MTIMNTWAVVQMDAYPEEDGETDVVFNVHWTLTGTDGTYSGNVYGTQGVTIDQMPLSHRMQTSPKRRLLVGYKPQWVPNK